MSDEKHKPWCSERARKEFGGCICKTESSFAVNNETPTPRTDAEIDDARNIALEFECKTPPPKQGDNVYVVSADFARQLERELNSSKDWNTAALAATSIASATIARLESERDQLGNVADELAYDLVWELDPWFKPRSLSNYNSLPHVIAKGKTK